MIDSFVTFYSMKSTLSVTINWKAVEHYFTVPLFVFQFSPDKSLENLSILYLALSGVKGLRNELSHLLGLESS